MLSIEQSNGSVFYKTSVQIPVDDYTLHMILKRGSVVSSYDRPLYVQALDFVHHNDKSHVFKMSLLEASRISEEHPEFDSYGLVAVWQLQTNGHIKFVSKAPCTLDESSMKQFLLDETSHEIVRSRYETFFTSLGNE